MEWDRWCAGCKPVVAPAMSAPITDQPASFISSSGHVDGLGRRLLAFDRETGAVLERLYLRPELAAFEPAIRERVDRLASFDDERFARPVSVERDATTGDLTVLSEFVIGSHLSDLLETAEEGGLVPGVDVALGFLLEALPAVSSFQRTLGCSHGLIAPSRLILTPAGQVVFLDPAFGSVIERLGLSKTRLWVELGIAAPQGSGAVRLDVVADIAQVALAAVMLVIGRQLREHEYPDSLPSLLMEVVEVAQIRASGVFATSLQRLLQRALPLTGRRPFGSADELANEIRLLLRREIGAEVCRQALLDFTEQMDAQLPDPRSAPGDPPFAAVQAAGESGSGHAGLDLDQVSLDALDSIEILDDDPDAGVEMSASEDDTEEIDPDFEEISLEPDFLDEADLPPPVPREPRPEPALFEDEPPAPADISTPDQREERRSGSGLHEFADVAAPLPEVADPWSFDPDAADRIATDPPAISEGGAGSSIAGSAPSSRFTETIARETNPSESLATGPLPPEAPSPEAASVQAVPVAATPVAATSVAATPADVIIPVATTPVDAAPVDATPGDAAPGEPAAVPDAPMDDYGASSSRRKKRQQKSARARKDKLRSAADSKPQPQAKPAEARPQSGWLVNPDRAAAFTPAVVEPAPPQPPAVIGHPAPPPMPVYPAPAPQPIVAPPPSTVAIPMPVYGAPPAPRPIVPPTPAPVAPVAATPAPRAVAPSSTPLRLKAEPPSGYAPPRQGGSITAMPYVHRGSMFEADPPRGFPWKMAVAVLVIVGIAIVLGRTYIPSRTSPDEAVQTEATPPPEAPAVVVMPKVETGDITISTQPAGARVLLDGKPVGQSPLKLADVPVGRHTLTFISLSGQVTRTVRVTAGGTSDVDVSIFSGWVAIFAPVVLDVAVNGRSIGTTEQNRLMLPAGRHELTLTNKELGYKGVQQVDVEPGEVRSITIDPRGPVSFNAIPWAEVWLDGQKLGDTPLANVRIPLGLREFVFRHPQFGDRKVTASIRADQPSAIGVDFTRPQ